MVFSSYSGLRVPKEAVRVMTRSQIYQETADASDDLTMEPEQTYVGVFVLEGSTAAWKTIRILHDNGESYVVELDKSSTDHLWPGDEIIVGARNLYDGKVVR